MNTQEFYIINGATVPYLRMELINDGRTDYIKTDIINKSLQDAVVKFSMKNTETGVLKISNAPCNVVLAKTEGCEEKYVIEYQWKERDTKEKGVYQGWFTINFNGNLTEENVDFPQGKLIVPISEDLMIYIK
jgi:hypothetical protein